MAMHRVERREAPDEARPLIENAHAQDQVTAEDKTRKSGLRPAVGIVGAGFMGRTHALAARAAGVETIGVVASKPDRLATAISTTGADRGYRSLTELLADPEIEVVHVCTPNASHFQIALAAIRAGKHVVCEKPLALDATQAAELVSAASRAGVMTAVPFVYRFHPMVREMRARLARGDAGDIGLVHGTYLQDWLAGSGDNWRLHPTAVGPSRTFADIGSHWFDLLEFVTGERVAAVSAQFSTLRREPAGTDGHDVPIDTEDSVTVQFRTTNGVVGVFGASQIASGRKNRLLLEVSGTATSFSFDQEEPEQLWAGDALGHRVLVRDPDRLSIDAGRYAVLPSGHAQGYQDCFNAFVADAYTARQGEAPSGLPGFTDGLRSARIVEAVVLSQRREARWIEIENPTGTTKEDTHV